MYFKSSGEANRSDTNLQCGTWSDCRENQSRDYPAQCRDQPEQLHCPANILHKMQELKPMLLTYNCNSFV